MHPSYGFQHSLFEPDFKMTEQIGWGLNDHDFLQQMVPRLEQLPRPFAAWLITLSLHHPFEAFPAAHKTLKLGALEGTSFGNYLHTMRFFDQALEDFRDGARARRPARRHAAGRLRRSRRRLRARRGAGADDRHRRRRRRVDAERSRAALHPRPPRQIAAAAGLDGRARAAGRARPISRRRSSRCSASTRRRCRTSAATCSARRMMGRCRVPTATGSIRGTCFSRDGAASSARRRAPRSGRRCRVRHGGRHRAPRARRLASGRRRRPAGAVARAFA